MSTATTQTEAASLVTPIWLERLSPDYPFTGTDHRAAALNDLWSRADRRATGMKAGGESLAVTIESRRGCVVMVRAGNRLVAGLVRRGIATNAVRYELRRVLGA